MWKLGRVRSLKGQGDTWLISLPLGISYLTRSKIQTVILKQCCGKHPVQAWPGYYLEVEYYSRLLIFRDATIKDMQFLDQVWVHVCWYSLIPILILVSVSQYWYQMSNRLSLDHSGAPRNILFTSFYVGSCHVLLATNFLCLCGLNSMFNRECDATSMRHELHQDSWMTCTPCRARGKKNCASQCIVLAELNCSHSHTQHMWMPLCASTSPCSPESTYCYQVKAQLMAPCTHF